MEGKLAGMGYPFEEDVPFLAQLGITTLVDLTGGFCQYAEAAKAHQMTVHSLSIQDFCPPTVEQIEQFLTILQNADGVSKAKMAAPTYFLINQACKLLSIASIIAVEVSSSLVPSTQVALRALIILLGVTDSFSIGFMK